jgi:hypothetical protein
MYALFFDMMQPLFSGRDFHILAFLTSAGNVNASARSVSQKNNNFINDPRTFFIDKTLAHRYNVE